MAAKYTYRNIMNSKDKKKKNPDMFKINKSAARIY